MRGDLVYEKLGEIDPALVAEALPEAAPMPELYRLGGNNPPPPKKRPNFRKALVICACLLLAGILLVGGSIALSRTVEFPSETETTETQSDQGNELTYQGIVTIGGFGPLTDSDDLESMGNEIKARFSAATPADVCDCIRDLKIQIGEDSLTYNRDHGCFRDGDTGKVYRLRDEDRAYMEDLLAMLEPPVIMNFTHATLHPLDAYTCTVSLVKNEDYPNIFRIKEIYLRPTAEGSDYRTDSFREIPDRDSFYCGTIPEDAPLGDYELVVSLFSPYTGRNTELTLTSPTPAVTVAAHTKQPEYVFFYETDNAVVTRGDNIVLTVGMLNKGDPIYRYTVDEEIRPEARLRKVADGETVEYVLSSTVLIEWYGHCTSIATDESGTGEVYLSGWNHKDMPLGTYDLILSFEGHEEVFPNALAVVNPDPSHSIEVTCSFPDGDTLPANGKGSMIVSVTLTGDTMYRYGKANCFCPSVILGTEKGTPIVWMTGPDQNDTDECVRSWENGQTLSFAYVLDFTHTDDEPVKPGVYNLYAYYADEDELLDTVLEGVFTVTDP